MGQESEKALLGLINKANASELKPIHVTYGKPVDVSDLSKVTVTGRNGYRGNVDVTYRRLGLNHLFSFFQPRILVDDLDAILTADQVIAKINERYPVRLEASDLTVEREAREDGDYYVVTAKDSSLVYKDSVTVGTRPRVQIPITDVILPETSSYVYPNTSESRAYARIYSGGWYLPECWIELSQLLVGAKADVNLTWLTTIVSGDQWLLDTTAPGALNLAGARVTYNGPVDGINLHPDDGMMLYRFPEAKFVVLLELSDSLCTGMVGKLTYYYGVKDEEAA